MSPNVDGEGETTSRCLKLLRLFWKFCKCVFSHVSLISLVVAYCVLGAYAFESLEAEHEKDVKKSIKGLRGNVTQNLWKITQDSDVLIRENWTQQVVEKLKIFETDLLKKMKKEGWDGSEEEGNIQWTLAGALFYSIIVITTIGYGHIAPKTRNGKVVTIFYAILGIPLMLLCLSNIGDVMASSFRFLYWKVCCYICTRPPKKRRPRNALGRAYSVRQPGRFGSSKGASFRRSIRLSQRSADSATLGQSDNIPRQFYSDPESRVDYHRSGIQLYPSATVPGQSTLSRYSADVPTPSPKMKRGASRLTTQSLDRKLLVGPNEADRTPVLINKYALDDFEEAHDVTKWPSTLCERESPLKSPANDLEAEEPELVERPPALSMRSLPRRCISVEGAPSRSRPSLNQPVRPASVFLDNDPPSRFSTLTRSKKARAGYTIPKPYKREAPSPRIMSPMGFAVHRQVYTDDFVDVDYDYYPSMDEHDRRSAIKPVPIWLCVFLVVSYIFGGAYLFSEWESWPFLDSAYFCFITLTTIGFGDFVPAHRLDAQRSIALCSLYLLFGIALLAMSFNLVQEEVINNVKSVAKRLGIIKDDRDEEDDDVEEDFDYVEDEAVEDHELG